MRCAQDSRSAGSSAARTLLLPMIGAAKARTVMDLEARVTFPGGLRVDAEIQGRLIPTEQPPSAGGTGSAPEPFALFAASLGTCAGFYVLRFRSEEHTSELQSPVHL